MTTLATIIALSLLTALIAAGFVWYGWALSENIRSIARNLESRKAKSVPAEPAPPLSAKK